MRRLRGQCLNWHCMSHPVSLTRPMEFGSYAALTLGDIAQYAANQGVPAWSIAYTTGPFTGEGIESILVRLQCSGSAGGVRLEYCPTLPRLSLAGRRAHRRHCAGLHKLLLHGNGK